MYVAGLKPKFRQEGREPYMREEVIEEKTQLHVADVISGSYVYKDYHGKEHKIPEQLISFYGDKYKLYHPKHYFKVII